LYAAPEYVPGGPMLPQVDVYALGVLFYEWLCGCAVFIGQTPAEIQAQHLAAPVPRLPAALERWQPLLDSLLAKHAGRRPGDAAEVLAALSRA
jgi:serine/threonine protein kinase